jgi:hypothetical protein
VQKMCELSELSLLRLSSSVGIVWPRMASDGLGPVSGGCDVSKLSKLLNLEVALSAPCIVCCTQVIAPASADEFPGGWRQCTGRVRRCKARQGRRGKTALRCGYLLPQ